VSLNVRLNCNFYTHRKTAKLRAALGDAALWIPPRLWAYAAENQPDGEFGDYTAAELASLIGYTKDPNAMLQALLQAGFMDSKPLRIHDWGEYNGFHAVYAARAKHAAEARWAKERTKEKVQERRGEEASIASSIGHPSTTSAKSTDGRHTSPPSEMWKLRKDLKDARAQLEAEKLRAKPDQGVVEGLQAEIQGIRKAIAEYGRTNGKPPSQPVTDSEPVSAAQVVSAALERTGIKIPHAEFSKGCEEARKAIDAATP
jgi:hypothetical protein